MSEQPLSQAPRMKRAVSAEAFVFLAAALVLCGVISMRMGFANMLNTFMKTAYALLMDTVFYIMAIAVLTGAMSALLSEFGVVSLLNKLLSPLMGPLYGLPGASVVGVLAAYMSDNPAILSLADDKSFIRYFKKYQVPALTNIGTAFGMGLIITTFVLGLGGLTGKSFLVPALIGNLGAVVGSIVSTRLMLRVTSKRFGKEASAYPQGDGQAADLNWRQVRDGSAVSRFVEAMLEGGKTGISVGVAIIPGVLVICSVVMLLTNGPGAGGVYTGAAYEGVAFLPWLGEKLQVITTPLFGFSAPEAIAVPITALGSAGAAMGLIPTMISTGAATGNDVAIFTAMCMCWSGYLSTHIAMMDSLRYRELAGKSIACHTVGGLAAGIAAHFMFLLAALVGLG